MKADAPATAAQGFGNVVHVLADEVASSRTPADLDVLMERLDSVWNGLAFDAPWKSEQEKDQARAALERFLKWHVLDRGGRTPTASEHDFDVTLEAGEYAVRIRGSMDRVEEDAEGRAYVVDFKTGKGAPTKDEVATHPQLAVYQLAVREGAVDEVFDGRRPEPGGAELVQLRQPAPKKEGGDAFPKVQAQEPLAGSGSPTCSPPPPGRSWTNGSRPPPAPTAPTAPSAPRAAHSRRGARWWTEGSGWYRVVSGSGYRFPRVLTHHRSRAAQGAPGIPFTPEQTACITAPPAPQVIVAGAGSGKTTVMAARVVWLVGTGQVAPEQVLGLTFTNKAAGELAERVRKALVAAGVTDPEVIDPDNPPGEPTISTYHAFAGRLLTEHGLRIGLEPSTRLLADATRYQLAAKVLREAPGPYPALTRSFPTLVSDLLALDGELSEHLVRPGALDTYDTELLRSWPPPSSATPTCARSPRPPRPAAPSSASPSGTGPPSGAGTSWTSATRSPSPPSWP